MKKGQIVEAIVERIDFPNKGICRVTEPLREDGTVEFVTVKNSVVGQKLKIFINKLKHKKAEGRAVEVLEKSPIEIASACPHFGECGGCTYLNLDYSEQLKLKETMVKDILTKAVENPASENWYEGIKRSPITEEYRNKMEFSFGDEYKDGPLALGMHKRGSLYDIVTVSECRLVHNDYRLILQNTLKYFQETNASYLHRVTHEGYLRHLLVRRGIKNDEILIALVTSTQTDKAGTSSIDEWKNQILQLEANGQLKARIAGILHIKNDSLADIVQSDETVILHGEDYFYEKLMDLSFKITPFSFFQTNTLGAEVLYDTARAYALEAMEKSKGDKPVIFDLYSGTGTIAQMMSPVAKRVVGVEIVEEAVEAAKENAKLNGLDNCSFIAGDVLKVLDELQSPQDRPNLIIIDPPRDGCHPKALPKIIAYGAPSLVYISCKVTSLARDLEMLQNGGYQVQKAVAIDQFPGTYHVETVVLMSKVK